MFRKQEKAFNISYKAPGQDKVCQGLDDRRLAFNMVLIFSSLGALVWAPHTRNWFTLFSEYMLFLVGTSIIWISNRYVIFYFRHRYPRFKAFGYRVRFQLLINILISALPVVSLSYVYCISFVKISFGIFLLESRELFLTSLILVLLINVFYECLFLAEYWQMSELEAERYRKVSLEARYQNLKNQLNPHFLFNSFNTLANLIDEDSQKAQQFVEGLSDVYRYVLNSQKKDWIELSEEIKCMHAYLFLLKMRHENNLHIHIHLEDKYYNYLIPPLSLQMLIENAIKHNEISEENPLQIQIFSQNEHIVVRNNRKQRKVIKSSTQVGLKNIQQRYRHLSGKTINVQESAEQFIVHLPIIKLQSA